MKTTDVANFNNNSGLYALAKALALAIPNQKVIASIAQYIRSNTIEAEKLGALLRESLRDAISRDSIFLDSSFNYLLSFCLERTDEELNIATCNESRIASIREQLSKVNFSNAKQQTVLLSQEERERFKIAWSQLLSRDELSESDLESFFKDANLDSISNVCQFVSEHLKDGVLLPKNIKTFESILYTLFFENAAHLYSQAANKPHALLMLSKSLAKLSLCVPAISDTVDLTLNAKKILAYHLLKKEWQSYVESYLTFIVSSNKALQKEELVCLAAKWNVRLDIYDEDGSLLNIGRKLGNPVAVVSIMFKDGVWKPIIDQVNLQPQVQNKAAIEAHENKSLVIVNDMLHALITKQKPQFSTTESRLALHAGASSEGFVLATIPLTFMAAGATDICLFTLGYITSLPESMLFFSALRAGSTAGSFLEAFSLSGILGRLANPYVGLVLVAFQGYTFWWHRNFQKFIASVQKSLEIYEKAIANNDLVLLNNAKTELLKTKADVEKYATTNEAKNIVSFWHFLHGLIKQASNANNDPIIADGVVNDLNKALSVVNDSELKVVITIELLRQLKIKTPKNKADEHGDRKKTAFNNNLALVKNHNGRAITKIYFEFLQNYALILRAIINDNVLPGDEEMSEFFDNFCMLISRQVGPYKNLLEIVSDFTVAIVKYKRIKKDDKSEEAGVDYSPAMDAFINTARKIQQTGLQKTKTFPYAVYVIINEILEETYRVFRELHESNKVNVDLDSLAIDLGLIPYGSDKSPLDEFQIIKIVRVFNIENPNAYHYHPQSFEDILKEISEKPEFAKMKFGNGRSWLHYLPLVKLDVNESTRLRSLILKACLAVIQSGISPYERDRDGNTCFKYIPREDLIGFATAFSPDIDKGFIGVREQTKNIDEFFVNAETTDTQGCFLLLSGPSGNGKLSLLKKIAVSRGYKIKEFSLSGKEDRYVGVKQHRITEFFEKEKGVQKLCLIFDSIQSTLPKKTEHRGVHELYNEEVVANFIKEFEKTKGVECVVVGSTSNIAFLNDAVESLVTTKIDFKSPNKSERRLILQHGLRMYKLADPAVVDKIVASTASWTSSNLFKFIAKVTKANKGEPIANQTFVENFNEIRDLMKGSYKDFELALPTLKLDDNFDYTQELIGLKPEVRKELETLRDFLMHPEVYKVGKSRPNFNLLLYGPPGTGKTSFARVVANSCNALVVIVDAGKYKGFEATQKLINIFAIAKSFEKSIVFIDEIDSVTRKESLAREALQTELEGFSKTQDGTLVVIGATNYKDEIASAILDRFTPVHIDLPDLRQRATLFEFYIKKHEHLQLDNALENNLENECANFALQTEGYSHRKIDKLVEKSVVDARFEANKTNDQNVKPVLKAKHVLNNIDAWKALEQEQNKPHKDVLFRTTQPAQMEQQAQKSNVLRLLFG